MRTKKKIANSPWSASRSDLDPPGARVDVLVDLADADTPQKEADEHRDASPPARSTEALPNVSWTRLAVAPFSFRWVIRRSAKTFVSPLRRVEDGDGHEHGRQHRQRRIHGRRAARAVYSTLSVLPAVLVAVAVVPPVERRHDVFAQRLVTHLKLHGATASLVEGGHDSAARRRTRWPQASPCSSASFCGVSASGRSTRTSTRAPGRSRWSRWPTRDCSRSSSSSSSAFSLSRLSPPPSCTTRAASCPRCRLGRRLDRVLALGAAFSVHRKIGPPLGCSRARSSSLLLGGTVATSPFFLGGPVERERQDLRLVQGLVPSARCL